MFFSLAFCEDNAFCRYNKTNEMTLITIGDFWKIECLAIFSRDFADYAPNISNGVTYIDCWRKETQYGNHIFSPSVWLNYIARVYLLTVIKVKLLV